MGISFIFVLPCCRFNGSFVLIIREEVEEWEAREYPFTNAAAHFSGRPRQGTDWICSDKIHDICPFSI